MTNGTVKALVRGVYDMQKLRISTGNRIVANYKAKLGIEPSVKEEESDAEAQKILKQIRKSYDKITEGVVSMPSLKNFKGDELISDYTDFCLVSQWMSLIKDEEKHFRDIGKVLSIYPIYTEFLEGVTGIGPAMAGVIISEFDIHKARHPSSFWKYAGLDVAEDGKGRSKKSEHLIDQVYKNKEGLDAIKRSITFNPFLKTKLLGVLGPSFIRCHKLHPNKYAALYYDYKNRLENHAVYKDAPVLHRHRMAIRKIVKLFLIDLHMKWRELEGLPVSKPYSEAKLGRVHGQ